MNDTAKPKWEQHAAAPNTHAAAYDLLHKHLADFKGLKLCDVPCGAGLFSARLLADGASVAVMDIEAVEPFNIDPALRTLGDANLGLPYGEGEFDALVSIEGIEHLENPSFFLRECARVVKPGGLVLISTPNVDSWRSRRYVARFGYHKFFAPDNIATKESGHMLPIDRVFFSGAAHKAGLEILEVGVNTLADKGKWWKEPLRPYLTRKLPAEMRGEIPFYGDVVIYLLKKRHA